MVEPDNGRPLFQTPPLLSIDTVTLSAPVTDHDTVTSGFGPTKVESGAAHAAAFDTLKLVMICGAAVVAGEVAGGLVAGVVLAVTGFAVVTGPVVAGDVVADEAVVVDTPETVVADDDDVIVDSVSVEVFDVELQPTMSALINSAGRNLRRDVITTLYAPRSQW